ncbi:POK25 protein, partial [Crotophaga sulcirostris]|nr:POK25 protein [Crotophaga sulcirostris]
FISQDNALADKFAGPSWPITVPNTYEQAHQSHLFFHQSSRVLAKQLSLSIFDAKSIVQTCPDCQLFVAIPSPTVNPQGIQALQPWQTDVTHIAEFGRLKYVHVSVDTYSHTVWATAH